jgi:hypothetical protein
MHEEETKKEAIVHKIASSLKEPKFQYKYQ